MSWLVWLLIGIIIGLIVEDLISTEIKYEGKIKQKGQNNQVSLTLPSKEGKRFRRKRKRQKTG